MSNDKAAATYHGEHVKVLEDNPRKPYKAYAAALAPAVVALVFAFTAGSDGGSDLTQTEVSSILALAAAAFGATFVTKSPKRTRKADEHGQVTHALVIVVLALFAALLLVVLLRACDGDNDKGDAGQTHQLQRHGLDWE